MNSLSSSSCKPPNPLPVEQGNWAYQSAQIEKTTIAGEQSSDIEIQTADGDKVTLSSEVTFESSAITYEQLNRTGASYSNSQGQIISASANSEIKMTVEGTLDAQEKEDIKAVLMNLFKMVKDFIAGKAPAEETHEIANRTTISAVKAEFDMNVSVTVAAQASANYAAQTPLQEKPKIQAAKTADRPAVSERVDKLTDRMISVVKNSGVDPSNLLKRLNRRLSRISHKFMHAGPAAWQRMRLRKQILEEFARKLEKLSAENDAVDYNKDPAGAEKAVNLNDPVIVETTASVSETILNAARQDVHFEFEYSAAAES